MNTSSQDPQQQTSALQSEIMDRYQTGLNFTRAYLEYFLRGRTLATLNDILNLPGPEPMWFEFAMSANLRGQKIYELLKPECTGKTRYLDVGCGYGGMLIAFAKAGFDVFGIDVSSQMVGYAKANCLDHNLSDAVTLASIEDDQTLNSIGTFDVITCLDVIEHVPDPANAIQKMARLLNPGGILLLEIPNKNSIGYVASDGHFQLFGITLLPKLEAVPMHHTFFPNYPYDVGEYHELDFYIDELTRRGCTSKLITHEHVLYDLDAMGTLLSNFMQAAYDYAVSSRPKLPAEIQNSLDKKISAYLDQLFRELPLALKTPESRIRFRQKYLTNFWMLLAQK